jgi:uncharacterized membrane protein YoaK (UPF0700 family)
VAACVDAVSYLRLGVFPANMTGNTVLLAIGIGAGSGSGADAAHAATALGGFVTGATLGGLARAECGSLRSFLLIGWGAEIAALGCAVGLALAGAGSAFLMIGLLSGAMGAQSATVAQLDLGVSTTYLTGTWTAVSSFVGRRARRARMGESTPSPVGRQVGVLICYFASAIVAGAVTTAISR